MSEDLDAKLAKLEKESVVHAWQAHREKCLRLARKLFGAQSVEDAAEIADKISSYILKGDVRAALKDKP